MNITDLLPLIALPIALAAIAWIFWRGHLGPRALAQAPIRDVTLTGTDLAVGFMLMLLGRVLGGLMVQAMQLDLTKPMDMALGGLLGQALAGGMPAAYLVSAALRTPRGLREVGLIPRRPRAELRWAVMGTLAALPIAMSVMAVMIGLGMLFGQDPPKVGHDALEQMRLAAWLPRVLLIVSAVVLAPLLEEIVYRGLLQTSVLNILGRPYRWSAVLIAALAFAMIHAGGGVAWQSLGPLFVLGVMLGWLYERTGSLWPSIAVHAAFNLINVTIYLAGSG